MTDEEALQFWLETYENTYSEDRARRAYKSAELRNFNTHHIDYYIKHNISNQDRQEMKEEYKKELLQDIENAKLWSQQSNWDLVTSIAITNDDELNASDSSDYPIADHAAQEGLAKNNSFPPRGTDYKTYKYYSFIRPFNVRVFYRENSDYEIAFVFTNLDDTKVIRISQRED